MYTFEVIVMKSVNKISKRLLYRLLSPKWLVLGLCFGSLSVFAQLPGPILPEHLLSQGAVSYSRGQYDKAARYLYQFVDVDPDHIDARKLLAATLLKSQEINRAVEVLTALPEEQWRGDRQYRALLAAAQLTAGDDINALKQWRALGSDSETPITTLLTLQGAATNGQPIVPVTLVDLGPEMIRQRIIAFYRLLSDQRYAAAILAVDELLKEDRRSALYNHLAGEVHALSHHLERARAFWEDAIRVGKPPLLSTLRDLADLYLSLGNRKRAEKLLTQALEQAPKHVDVILANVEFLIGQGALARARVLLEQSWFESADGQVAVKLIELLMQQADYPAALARAEEFKSKYPDRPESTLNLGLSLLMNSQIGMARMRFQELAEHQPEAAEPWYLLATTSMRAQDYLSALQELDRAITLDSDYLPARLLRAELFFLGGDYSRALTEVAAVQDIASHQGLGFKLEGDIRMAQEDYRAAVRAYQQAHNKSPSVQTTLLLNHAQRAANATEDALSTLRNWLAIAPQDHIIRLQLAMQLEQTGQLADAREEYERVLDQDPNNLIVLNNLAWLLRDQDPQRALALAETALTLGAERPEILDTVGWLLVHSGQHERGLRLLKQAAMLAPHLPQIRYHQALAYEQAKRYAEALDVLAEVSIDDLDAELRAQITQLYDRLKASPEG